MTFDSNAFLNQGASAPLSTQYENVPEGEYKAIVDDGEKAIEFKEITGNDGRVSHQAVIQFAVLDDAVKTALGRDKVLVRGQFWLDLNAAGGLDTSKGKNVKLGQLVDAVGLNSQPWNFGQLKGRGPVMIKVGHRADKNDPQVKYAEVTRVAKIS